MPLRSSGNSLPATRGSKMAGWQRLLSWFGASRVGAWLLSHILPPLDIGLFRLSRGRTSLSGMLSGLPVVILTTTGARSGRPHTVPLLAILDGSDLAVVASNWGNPRHPAWYRNLLAHPEATATLNGRAKRYLAREVSGAEYERLWRKAVDLYSGYAVYRQRTGRRTIPIILLTALSPSPER